MIAGRVYFATLKGTTYALDARTGAPLWTFPDGKYSPVVADAKRLYLIGYARIYGLDERRQRTQRKLSAAPRARVLRKAGFRHVPRDRHAAAHAQAVATARDHTTISESSLSPRASTRPSTRQISFGR